MAKKEKKTGKKVKRIFKFEWDEEHGPEYLNEDNLMTCIKTTTCIGEHIEIAIEDVTGKDPVPAELPSEESAPEKVEEPATETPEAGAAEVAKCKNCGLRIRALCHRFPPKGDAGSRDGFPRVKDDDWCGEHRPADKIDPE